MITNGRKGKRIDLKQIIPSLRLPVGAGSKPARVDETLGQEGLISGLYEL
jgi:hypothetical protein